MRLAAEDITIKIDGEHIVLRPTLRVALRLERRHQGLDALLTKIQDGDLDAIADVLREHSSAWSDVPSFIESLSAPHGLYAGVEHLIPALIAHVYALAGVDIDAVREDQSTAEGDPRVRTRRDGFAAHLVDLFKIATGWLGWSPETAWSATPAEIRAAQAGLIDFRNALAGKQPAKPDARSLDQKWTDLASRWAHETGTCRMNILRNRRVTSSRTRATVGDSGTGTTGRPSASPATTVTSSARGPSTESEANS